MTDLFSSEGRAALARLLAHPAVVGFDFDGTLAPIQARPEGVAMAPALAERFAGLTRRLPVAVITGRSVADVAPRLTGSPRWIVGNHGAEGMPGADPSRLAAQARTCAAWRAQLARLGHGAGLEGCFVEDKTYTLCLHYRQAPDRDAARRLLDVAAHRLVPPPHIVTGKCVFNLLPEGSADKFIALATLAALAGEGKAFFIGDDDTDETVFARAPASWVTVRVGASDGTAARFVVADQAEVGEVIDLLVALAGC